MGKYLRFEDLEIWQEGMRLCKEVYVLLNDCKDYGLKDQMQRAAVSVPSNIAEGYERKGTKETCQFLYVAKGSCGELRTQLYLAVSLKLVDSKKGLELVEQAANLSVRIYSYARSISREV